MNARSEKLTVVIIALLAIFFSEPASAAEDLEKCLKCHDATWKAGLAKAFIHSPFLEKQCLECHCEFIPDAQGVDLRQQSNRAGIKVQWLGRHFTPALEHWFKFPAPPAGGDLVIDATVTRKLSKHRQIQLPPLADLPRSDNDNSPPRLSGVRVAEVRAMLFYSATIEWESDEPADAKVEFGSKDIINQSSPLDNNLSTHHQVTLVGIAPRKSYRFKVVSADIHGNRATSDIFTFSTEAPFSLLDEQPFKIKSYPRNLEIEQEFFQSDGDYLVKITANQPVEVGLSLLPTTRVKVIKGNEESATFKHPITTDGFNLNISLCFSCHQKYIDGPSHPVNVYPKRGMIIPAEYPTLSDGRITCSTCHEHHASNLKHRTIKLSNKELCLGCHKDMG